MPWAGAAQGIHRRPMGSPALRISRDRVLNSTKDSLFFAVKVYGDPSRMPLLGYMAFLV